MLQNNSLVSPVIERGKHQPQQQSIIFIHQDGTERVITAGRFYQSMSQYALALQAIGLEPDDLVILVLPHSPELLAAFWGALYMGSIPSIFPFLTEKLDPLIYKERVRLLVAHSAAKAVITYPEFKVDLAALLRDLDCRVLSSDEILTEDVETADFRPLGCYHGQKIAFLQYSSGTTGLQKGVALSHQAVINQIDAYSRAIAVQHNDVIVSWLPLYHDMGLIAGFIMPLVLGIPLILLSPFHWVRDPKSLLWAIHRHRGSLVWLPNFAFNHCVRAIQSRDLAGLNLDSWRMAINCSEPTRHDSQQMFLERFQQYGFKPNALATCYAMAENTFAVTQSAVNQPATVDWVHLSTLQEQMRARPVIDQEDGATPMVSCGFPISGTEVSVVDENGQTLPDRNVGEIIIRGNAVLTEYFRRPDLTDEALGDGWYFTGDMGYLTNGELYVSGRKKDLIIVGGKNIYPPDLEAIANGVAGIYAGRAVAFGLPDERLGSEKIVMVCELNPATAQHQPKQIEQELRRRVVQQTEVTLADVRLVTGRWLIKTSSGKIARSANRDKYLQVFRL